MVVDSFLEMLFAQLFSVFWDKADPTDTRPALVWNMMIKLLISHNSG